MIIMQKKRTSQARKSSKTIKVLMMVVCFSVGPVHTDKITEVALYLEGLLRDGGLN